MFWLLATVGITVFIFGNSFMNYEASHSSSGAVAGMIGSQTASDYETVEFLIRKTAHLIEFAGLGIGVMKLKQIGIRQAASMSFWFPLFYVLAVGVLDEYIQSFSNRSSSTGDVILDFFGGLLGMAVVLLFQRLFEVIQNRSKKVQ